MDNRNSNNSESGQDVTTELALQVIDMELAAQPAGTGAAEEQVDMELAIDGGPVLYADVLVNVCSFLFWADVARLTQVSRGLAKYRVYLRTRYARLLDWILATNSPYELSEKPYRKVRMPLTPPGCRIAIHSKKIITPDLDAKVENLSKYLESFSKSVDELGKKWPVTPFLASDDSKAINLDRQISLQIYRRIYEAEKYLVKLRDPAFKKRIATDEKETEDLVLGRDVCVWWHHVAKNTNGIRKAIRFAYQEDKRQYNSWVNAGSKGDYKPDWPERMLKMLDDVNVGGFVQEYGLKNMALSAESVRLLIALPPEVDFKEMSQDQIRARIAELS